MFAVEIGGMKQIQDQLNGLGKAVGPILRQSANASGRVLQKAIADATPIAGRSRKVKGQEVSPGLLRSAIGMRVSQAADKSYELNVGLNVGRKRVSRGATPQRGKSQAYYGNFLALNTPDRWTGERTRRKTVGGVRTEYKDRTKNRRMYRGRVTGFQWVSRAVESSRTRAGEAGKAAMDAGIAKAAGVSSL